MPTAQTQHHLAPAKGKISFKNTEIAFQNKSNEDLNRAHWLFKLIGNNFLVKIGPPMTNFAFSIGLPIQGIFKNTIFKQFCGGESIEDCKPAIYNLSTQHVGTILDYSVEGEESVEVFDQTYQEILRTVQYAAQHPTQVPFAVFKPTGLGRFELYEKIDAGQTLSDQEKIEFEHIKARFDGICKLCYEKNVKVLIDAEHSWIQQSIDDLAREMMMKYNQNQAIVYQTYQLYRHDKLASLKADYYLAKEKGFFLGAKLVRGAYMEIERDRAEEMNYPSPIQPNKAATDRDYDLALDFCLDHLDTICFMAGTHNEESSNKLVKKMVEHGIDAKHPHVYFAQLLGMSDHITFNLAAHGYNSAKYMPYGPVKSVMPYLFRRAQENTSVAGQTGRELTLIRQEIKRRKLQRK